MPLAADLTAANGAQALVAQVRNLVGERLDIIVANAGISKADHAAGPWGVEFMRARRAPGS
jgi:3-oxoacyl-[acyl-carrier protein] reductase